MYMYLFVCVIEDRLHYLKLQFKRKMKSSVIFLYIIVQLAVCLWLVDNASTAVWFAATSVHSIQRRGRSWLWWNCKVNYTSFLDFTSEPWEHLVYMFLCFWCMATVWSGSRCGTWHPYTLQMVMVRLMSAAHARRLTFLAQSIYATANEWWAPLGH